MVVLGYDDTLQVTVDDIAHHTAAVARTKPRALIVADLPWMSYHVSVAETVRNAATLIRAGAESVKLEGGRKRLPMHPTPVVRKFLEGLARELPAPQRQVLKRLTTPQVASLILDYLVKDPLQRRSFGAMLSNTASPTVLRAGSKVTSSQDERRWTSMAALPDKPDGLRTQKLARVVNGKEPRSILRSCPPSSIALILSPSWAPKRRSDGLPPLI
jgi:hypothetical protein